MNSTKEFFTYFLVYSILLAIPFVGVALLWIGLIMAFGLPGFIIALAITFAVLLGWMMTYEKIISLEFERRRQKPKFMD